MASRFALGSRKKAGAKLEALLRVMQRLTSMTTGESTTGAPAAEHPDLPDAPGGARRFLREWGCVASCPDDRRGACAVCGGQRRRKLLANAGWRVRAPARRAHSWVVCG